MKQIISFHGNILAFVHWAISNIGMPYCLDLSDIDDTVIFHPVIIWHACVCNVIKFLNIWSLYRWEKYYSRESVKLTKKLNMTKVCIILYILNRHLVFQHRIFMKWKARVYSQFDKIGKRDCWICTLAKSRLIQKNFALAFIS